MSNVNQHIKRLIVADDDSDDQILLKEAIDDYQFPPATKMVSDGCQLMGALSADLLPDLVLVDLNMPNKNGIECLLEIRSDRKFETLPIIVLSTSRDPHDIEACFNSGASLFFSKPYTFKELKSLIHSILSVDWQLFDGKLSKQEFLAIAKKGHYSTPIFSA